MQPGTENLVIVYEPKLSLMKWTRGLKNLQIIYTWKRIFMKAQAKHKAVVPYVIREF
jgi:hypothetical protein